MDKFQIYKLLKENNIEYELTEHEATFSMKDVPGVDLPYPEADAKNLFVRDKKKHQYYLITVRGEKRVDLKKFRENHNTKSLSFASAEEMADILELTPGSVSPFGLLSDTEHRVKYYIDKEFWEDRGLIGIHPNDNTATVWLKVDELVKIIENHGTEITIVTL